MYFQLQRSINVRENREFKSNFGLSIDLQKTTPQKQSENLTEYYQSVTEDFFDPETSLEDLVEPSVKIEVFEEVKEDSVQPIDFTLVDNDTKLNYLGEIEESDELDSCIVDDDRGPESLGEYKNM